MSVSLRSFIKLGTLLLLPVLLFNGCQPGSNPATNEPPESLVSKIQSDVDYTADRVEKIRGLEFKKPVYAGLMTKAQFSEYLTSDPEWEQYTQNTSAITNMLIQTGYILKSHNITDFAKTLKDYYSGFPYAFYMPGKDSIIIICQDGSCRDIAEQSKDYLFTTVLAHELTHALQDQHFGLSPDTGSYARTTDFSYAKQCLHEGDASLVEGIYTYELFYGSGDYTANMASSFCMTLADTFYNGLDNRIYNFPKFMEVPSLAPYYIGAAWISGRYVDYQWNGVNERYRSGELSMLEVLSNDELTPTPVLLNRFYKYMDKSGFWSEDVLGPMDISLILNEFDSPGTLKEHLRSRYGYRGDRLIYWNPSSARNGSFIWAFAFGNIFSAEKAFQILSSLVADDNDISQRANLTSKTEVSSSHHEFVGEYKSAVITKDSLVWWVENLGENHQAVIEEISNPQMVKAQISAPASAHNSIFSLLDRRRKLEKLR